MHPPENGGDPSRQVGQVNLSAAADRPSILLAVILGAATLIIMGDRTAFAWKDTPTYNYIDELVYNKLKSVKILPSEVWVRGPGGQLVLRLAR